MLSAASRSSSARTGSRSRLMLPLVPRQSRRLGLLQHRRSCASWTYSCPRNGMQQSQRFSCPHVAVARRQLLPRFLRISRAAQNFVGPLFRTPCILTIWQQGRSQGRIHFSTQGPLSSTDDLQHRRTCAAPRFPGSLELRRTRKSRTYRWIQLMAGLLQHSVPGPPARPWTLMLEQRPSQATPVVLTGERLP